MEAAERCCPRNPAPGDSRSPGCPPPPVPDHRSCAADRHPAPAAASAPPARRRACPRSPRSPPARRRAPGRTACACVHTPRRAAARLPAPRAGAPPVWRVSASPRRSSASRGRTTPRPRPRHPALPALGAPPAPPGDAAPAAPPSRSLPPARHPLRPARAGDRRTPPPPRGPRCPGSSVLGPPGPAIAPALLAASAPIQHPPQ